MITVPAAAALLTLSTGIAAPSPAAAGPAMPAPYHYRTVAVPGYPSVYIQGISDSGRYAGEGCQDRNCTKVTLFVATAAGKTTFYTLPFANYSPTGPFNAGAAGMDNAGAVIGDYTDAHGAFHGYLRAASGVLTELNDPLAAETPGGGTSPEGISPDGSVIVGAYVDAAGALHGFLLRDGTYTTYDVPGAVDTEVDIYNHREFGGAYVAADGAVRGYWVINGKLHTIAAPVEGGARHARTILSGLDSAGTVFGSVLSANVPVYGFAYANGRYTIFRDPNQAGTSPQAGTVIESANSHGAVVGYYSYTNGSATGSPYTEGFIAWPDGSRHSGQAPRREHDRGGHR